VNVHILKRDVNFWRFIAAAIVLGFGLSLASCGAGGDRGNQFADYVADHWPRWAGGMPDDVPPRPGAPGYNEFVAHGQTNPAPVTTVAPSVKTAASKTKMIAQPAPAVAVAPVAPAAPDAPVTDQPAEDSSVVKGGLY